ncbi:DUF5958 family protein [Amycolatopsis carbonis]|uniref:DUF5958 family protein n=1 Tax=Amycolatopsis carbonis TaxID=715471 RepID=A0A9Y2ILH5_9PSEU|nr:DUF5958 family protein [Amycolatopsis sp. 2-15]WIX81559.1 DUF5958 family protein [Amycolatopsis sp. 2-15]
MNPALLNELAQGLRPLDQGMAWFESLNQDGRHRALIELQEYCTQARATADDVAEAASRVGLKPGNTAVVVASTGRIPEPMAVQLRKLTELRPPDQQRSAFRLLVGLLSVADERRRRRCGGDCTHWWHHPPTPHAPNDGPGPA